MLLYLIAKLAKSEAYSNKSIACELRADENLIEKNIGQLQRLGHIVKDNMDSLSSSHNCDCDKI